MPPAAPAATCPNCHAALSPRSRQCSVCKLEVAQMAAFAAAKKAAQQRGIKTTTVETNEPPAWRSPGTLIKAVLLLALVAGLGWLGYHFLRPKPPRYVEFPATAQDAAKEFMANVAGGDATYDKAYFLIADAVRSTKASDDRGDYVQVFNLINHYLAAEFGPDWMTQTAFAPDPADPNVIVARVALETLHVRTAQQTPAEKLAAQGPHYGILGVDELDVKDAVDLRRDAFIRDFLGGVAGNSALSNWDEVVGANAANRHLPRFITKMLILQALRNPRAATWKAAIQANPFRADPVIQARLTLIVSDERYDVSVREKAKAVLTDNLSEEDRAAAGIP